jgi:hypothetical protein
MAAAFCVHCGLKLTGQYCGKCGRDYGATATAQRASSPLATATVQHVGSSAIAVAQPDVSSLTAGAQRAASPATAGAQRAVSPTSRPARSLSPTSRPSRSLSAPQDKGSARAETRGLSEQQAGSEGAGRMSNEKLPSLGTCPAGHCTPLQDACARFLGPVT